MNYIEGKLIFEVNHSNPNGDPNNDNQPRQNILNGHGYTTDVSTKHIVREFVLEHSRVLGDGYDIFISKGAVLNDTLLQHFEENKPSTAEEFCVQLCRKFYDIRAFGAVLSTKWAKKAKKGEKPAPSMDCVRGPVQFGFSKSVLPINILDIQMTRKAHTTGEDKNGAENNPDQNRTFGKKYVVDHAVYEQPFFINGSLAEKTGFSEKDFNILLDSLRYGFTLTRSTSKMNIVPRRIVLFKHSSPLGNLGSGRTLGAVNLSSSSEAPRSWSEYDMTVPNLPADCGVSMEVIEL